MNINTEAEKHLKSADSHLHKLLALVPENCLGILLAARRELHHGRNALDIPEEVTPLVPLNDRASEYVRNGRRRPSTAKRRLNGKG